MSLSSAFDLVESLRVGCQDRFFIGPSEIVAAQDMLDFDPARLGVEAFVRKVGGKDKRVVAGFFDRVAETVEEKKKEFGKIFF